MSSNPKIACLALDIGGVICADTWEDIFLTPEKGLSAIYNLDPEMVKCEAAKLWKIYACSLRTESEYWAEWDNILGTKLDRSVIEKLYGEILWFDQSAREVIKRCLENNIQVAFVSNSTQFWFPMQMKAANLEDLTPHIMQFLSHEIGHRKMHDEGGLAKLAGQIKPETILFVDDRIENINVAANLGMSTLHYDRHDHSNLASALSTLI